MLVTVVKKCRTDKTKIYSDLHYYVMLCHLLFTINVIFRPYR